MLGLLFGLFCLPGPAPIEPPSVEALERATLTQRRSLTTGAIVLKVAGVAESGKDKYTQQWRIWFDVSQDRWRCDCDQDRASLHSPTPLTSTIQCVNCEERGRYVDYTKVETPTISNSLDFNRLTPEIRKERLWSLVDPRLLGLFSTQFGLLKNYHFQSWLENPLRNPPKIVSDTWKDMSCWRLEFDNRWGVRYQLWIVPGFDSNIVKVRTERREGATVFVTTLESEMKKWGNAWFPSRTIYESRKGQAIVESETVEVVSATFNEPIPEDVFRLRRMNLKEGLSVISTDRKPYRFWWIDGQLQTTHPAETAPGKLEPVLPPATFSTSWYWALGAVAVAALALYLFWRSNPHREAAK